MSAGVPWMACFAAACALAIAACGGRREPSSQAPTVYVPAPVAGYAANGDKPLAREPRRSEPSEPDTESPAMEIEITHDGGTVQIASVQDAGVRVWGTLQRFDGGFRFQGGFSTGSSVPEAGP